jgi:hypothetical protein
MPHTTGTAVRAELRTRIARRQPRSRCTSSTGAIQSLDTRTALRTTAFADSIPVSSLRRPRSVPAIHTTMITASSVGRVAGAGVPVCATARAGAGSIEPSAAVDTGAWLAGDTNRGQTSAVPRRALDRLHSAVARSAHALLPNGTLQTGPYSISAGISSVTSSAAAHT